ncbi:MAG: hypothetical protein ACRDYC_13680 [Acidimicrobiales bacterium]
MAEWLSAAWAAEVRRVASGHLSPDGPGGAVEVVITGGPEGEIRVGPLGDIPEDQRVVFTLTAKEAAAVVRDELRPSVAFMRGTMKTAGSPGAVLGSLSATATPEFEAFRAEVAAIAEE